MRRLPLLLAVLLAAPAWGQGLTEVALDAGIDHIHADRTWMGGGVALFDADGDGDLDVYLTGGENRDALFRNDGDWLFTDISEAAGLAATDAVVTMGVTVGDVDGDGDGDVFLTARRGSRSLLLRNDGGTFTDVTFQAGFPDDDLFTGSATFGDPDLDGDLDLYETAYVETPGFLYDDAGQVIGYDHTCSADRLWINDGTGVFADQAAALGVAQTGCGLAVTFSDIDGDADPDLLVANDFGEWITPNVLFRNEGGAGFVDVAPEMGAAVEMYGMSMTPGDVDRDGRLDYYMSNIGQNVLLRRGPDGTFTDIAMASGVDNTFGASGLFSSSWGAAFADLDHDGHLDLLLVNGHMPTPPLVRNELLAPDRVYRNLGDGTFEDVSDAWGFTSTGVGRGLAMGDLDGDGDLDAVVSEITREPGDQNDARAKVYRNDLADGHWLAVDVEGVQANRDGIGARIEVVAGAERWTTETNGGASYLSRHAPAAHLGLGAVTAVDSVIVTWPGGAREVLLDVLADQTLVVPQTVSTAAGDGPVPGDLSVEAIGPNPFRDTAWLTYTSAAPVSLRVVDALGRVVAETTGPAGRGRLDWDGRDAASGAYLYILSDGSAAVTGSITRVR